MFFRLHSEWTSLKGRLRKFWWRRLGATIGRNSRLGKMSISFPAGVSIGDNCLIEDGVRMQLYLPYTGSSITIGDHTFIGSGTQININRSFTMGNGCLIAANCIFSDANHIYADPHKPMRLQGCRYESIRLEDDVWLGCGVKVLAGVTIHQGAVVAAGAVVNRDIPAREIWGGVPARKIKDRKP